MPKEAKKAPKPSPKALSSNNLGSADAPQPVRFSAGNFAVDAAQGVLTDVALLGTGHEAKGHGLYLDERSGQTCLEALQGKDSLRAYIAHPTFEQWWNDDERLMSSPGWFSGFSFADGVVRASRMEFYQAFRNSRPDDFSLLMEMAEKTPDIFGLSIEFRGYAVYVDEAGNEYGRRPEDVDLLYEGLPAVRFTRVDAAAFVGLPAATNGLFSQLSGKGRQGRKVAKLLTELAEAMDTDESQSEESDNNDSPDLVSNTDTQTNFATHTNTDTIMNPNLVKALRAMFKEDKARLGRAFALAADTELAEDAAEELVNQFAENIKAKLEVEDLRAELAEKPKGDEAADTKQDLADALKAKKDAEARIQQLKEGGLEEQLETGKGPKDGEVNPFALATRNHTAAARMLKENPEQAKAFAAAAGVSTEAFAFSGQAPSFNRGQFAITDIDNLITPDIWIPGTMEFLTKRPTLWNSGVIVTSPEMDMIASGGGVQANVPFLKEPDITDEIQVESTGPTVQNFASAKQVAAILNRVSSTGITALAKQVTSIVGSQTLSDPLGAVLGVYARIRARQWETILLNILRGCFNEGASSPALSALVEANFVEAIASQTAAHLIDSDMILDAAALMGEAKETLEGGVLICHSAIETALNKQDEIDYIRDSQGQLVMRVYKGLRVLVNDSLVRDGTTDGKVYDTYLLTPGSVAFGRKPQSQMVGDVASLTIEEDEAKNDRIIYDRNRLVIHPLGLAWGGTPSGQSATNAELRAKANWSLAFGDVKNVGCVQIVTNG